MSQVLSFSVCLLLSILSTKPIYEEKKVKMLEKSVAECSRYEDHERGVQGS